MLMGAARNALRAFNARVSLTCLYVVAHKLPYLFYGLVFVAHLFRRGSVLRDLQQISWRTGRMARHRQKCIRLPYTAPEASHRASFFKVQPQTRGNGNRERVSCFHCRSRFGQLMLTIE